MCECDKPKNNDMTSKTLIVINYQLVKHNLVEWNDFSTPFCNHWAKSTKPKDSFPDLHPGQLCTKFDKYWYVFYQHTTDPSSHENIQFTRSQITCLVSEMTIGGSFGTIRQDNLQCAPLPRHSRNSRITPPRTETIFTNKINAPSCNIYVSFFAT